MSHQRTNGRAIQQAHAAGALVAMEELRGHRLLLAVGAILLLSLSAMEYILDGMMPELFWQRIGMAALLVGAHVATHLVRGMAWRPIIYATYFLGTGWVVYLLNYNDFAFEYGASLLVVVAAIGTSFRRTSALYTYSAFTVAAVTAVVLLTEGGEFNRALYVGQVAMVLLLAAGTLGARLRADAELAQSEERYAISARGSNDGLWDWDLRANRVYYSPRWAEMLGLAADQLEPAPDSWFRRVHPDDLLHLKARIAAHLSSEEPHVEVEYRALHRDGEYRWMLTRGIAVRDEAGQSYRMAGSQTDISERKRSEAQLVHDALHDPLTGLANRALFVDRLERVMAAARRRKAHNFAVLFLDLDRFKIVNDSLGHLAGDEVLVSVARRLEICLRKGDTVARFGGDEFVVLLDDLSDVSEAARVAERIQVAIGEPMTVAGKEIRTTTCVGLSLSTTGYARPEEMLRDSDTALYRAKSAGRSRCAVFDRTMHAEAVAQLQLELEMRGALDRDEFVLHYQPIMHLDSGVLTGFEALLRWQHPDGGLLFPKSFISIAEDTGLIVPLGMWVVEHACRQLREWQATYPDTELRMSVNLSGRQMLQPDLADRIEEILQETGVRPDLLNLEITEATLMADIATSGVVLERLRSRGVQITIDDFGTGYSSLGYLNQFPVDRLKIDPSFVASMRSQDTLSEVVGTIATLARNLGMTAVAEGVETDEQLRDIRELGCDFAQGYLFSEPLPPALVSEFMAQTRRAAGVR
jgi:diguanylate cyclase (GGDEF)-like protein/PAS domain S-box-containing protein